MDLPETGDRRVPTEPSRIVKSEVSHARNGDVSLAYQVIGSGHPAAGSCTGW
jgi:hypothetical protein